MPNRNLATLGYGLLAAGVLAALLYAVVFLPLLVMP